MLVVVGVGVAVAVSVGVAVFVCVAVGTDIRVAVLVGVRVGVGVGVAVGVFVRVGVAVADGVKVGVRVGVAVGVFVRVGVAVADGVKVGVGVGLASVKRKFRLDKGLAESFVSTSSLAVYSPPATVSASGVHTRSITTAPPVALPLYTNGNGDDSLSNLTLPMTVPTTPGIPDTSNSPSVSGRLTSKL